MSHYDLYRRQQHDRAIATSRNRPSLHALIPRSSKRDVFSEECNDSVGYPFPRANEDRETFQALNNNNNNRAVSSEPLIPDDDSSQYSEQPLDMTLHPENIVISSWEDESDHVVAVRRGAEFGDLSNAETLKMSSAHSSLFCGNDEQRQIRPAPTSNVPVRFSPPWLGQQPFVAEESDESASLALENVVLEMNHNNDHDRVVLDGGVPPKLREPTHSRRQLLAVAGVAFCLLLLVVAGTLVWWVLGSRKDEATSSNGKPYPPPSMVPSQVPLESPAPVFTPSPNPFQLWAEQFLPHDTLLQAMGSQQPSFGNSSFVVMTPQAHAFEWIQQDPYFNNATAIQTMSQEEVAAKRLTRFGLATLYYATGGEMWMGDSTDNVTGWLSGQDECQWPFFSCAQFDTLPISRRRLPSSAHIQSTKGAALDLRNVVVSGNLPPEISLLPALSVLAITDNLTDTNQTQPLQGLQGTLPSHLGLLSDLTVLELHNNHFTGTFPSELGLLTRLEKLYLHGNSFDRGSILPVEVCNLAKLPNPNLREITLDCTSVTCNCGCTCPTGGSSTDTHNIFDISSASPSAAITSTATTLPNDQLIVPLNSEISTSVGAAGQSLAPTNISLATELQTAMPTFVDNNGSLTGDISGNETGPQFLCNGLAHTCGMRLPQVLFPMVHNAMSSTADGFSIPNHNLSLEDALEAGYRGFNLDVCDCGGRMVFCHTLCVLGSREPIEVFGYIHRFLEVNPHEVLVFSFQIDNNSRDQPQDIFEFYGILESLGENFTEMIYVHEPEGAWPTLRSLIETNKRMIMFHFNGPQCEQPNSCPQGLHYYFDYVAETEFSIPDVDSLLNTTFSCRITRGGSGKNRAFFAVNNFLSIPSEATAPTMNGNSFLKSRIEACATANGGIDVSFLYIDHWSVGDVLDYTMAHNQGLEGSV